MHLFVYGTLLRETGNDRARLLESETCLGTATICGRLYDVGQFPAAVLAEEGVVRGKVYRVDESRLPELDSVEFCSGETPAKGDLFFRTTVVARVESGAEVECVAYLWNGSTEPLTPIPGGDYVSWLLK